MQSLVRREEQIPAEYAPLRPGRAGQLPTVPEMDMMRAIASNAIAAVANQDRTGRMLPLGIKTVEQAMMVMLKGHEYGLQPLTALSRLFIVNGRIEPDTQTLMGLVRKLDPTARFVFTKYERSHVEVELYRGGDLTIRVLYDREDAKLSGQSKVKRRRKWVGGRQTNDFEDVLGPWQLFERDMLAYNAVKRCCRLGAPDLINMIMPDVPFISDLEPAYRIEEGERTPGDDVVNPLTRALNEGTVAPADVFGAGEDDPDRINVDQIDPNDDGEVETVEDHPVGVDTETGEIIEREAPEIKTAPEPPETKPDPTAPETKSVEPADIEAKLISIKASWDAPSYARLYRSLLETFPPIKGEGGKPDGKLITAAARLAVMAWLREQEGEPPA